MAEKLSVSKETPKIHLPLKDLVGVQPSKKEKDLTEAVYEFLTNSGTI